MNKKTRKFIYGILILLICGLATAHNIHKVITESPFKWGSLIAALICAYGLWIGLNYIDETIK